MKQHSHEEQVELLRRFDEERHRRSSASAAAEAIGASLPSIYRWRRRHQPGQGMPRPTHTQHASVDTAIARLADRDNQDRLSFLEALFKFAAWLRWPSQPEVHAAAISTYIVTYLAGRHSNETLHDLKEHDRNLVLRNIRIDSLSRMFSVEAPTGPIFELYPIRGQNYNELDFLSHVAWFIMAYVPPTDHPHDALSLSKAYIATQGKLFKFYWPMVESTFRKFWHTYGAAAPFHYVERYHSALNFTLHPLDPDFSTSVDEIIEQSDLLRSHLGRCRSAVELMVGKLDRRTREKMSFPAFPASLAPEPILPPPLPEMTQPMMKMAARGDKRKRLK